MEVNFTSGRLGSTGQEKTQEAEQYKGRDVRVQNGEERRTDSYSRWEPGLTNNVRDLEGKNLNIREKKRENDKAKKWVKNEMRIAKRWEMILKNPSPKEKRDSFYRMVDNGEGQDPIELVPWKDRAIGCNKNAFQKSVFGFLSALDAQLFSDYKPDFAKQGIKDQMLEQFVKDCRFPPSSRPTEEEIKSMMRDEKEAFDRILRFIEARAAGEELLVADDTESEKRKEEKEREIFNSLKIVLGKDGSEKREKRKKYLMGLVGSRVLTVLSKERLQVELEFPERVIEFLSRHKGKSLEYYEIQSEEDGTSLIECILKAFEQSLWSGVLSLDEIDQNKLMKAMEKDREEFISVLKILINKYQSEIQKSLWQENLKKRILGELDKAVGEGDSIESLKKYVENNIYRVEMGVVEEMNGYDSLKEEEKKDLQKQVLYEILGFLDFGKW